MSVDLAARAKMRLNREMLMKARIGVKQKIKKILLKQYCRGPLQDPGSSVREGREFRGYKTVNSIRESPRVSVRI